MGGWKASGLGTRHGAGGIRKYTRQQSLLVTRLRAQARPPHVPVQGAHDRPARPRREAALRARQARLRPAATRLPRGCRRAKSFPKLAQAFRTAVVCFVAMTDQPAAAAVLEHLPAGVVVLDAEGRLAAGNPAAERLLGPIPADGGRALLRRARLPPPRDRAGVALHRRDGARARRRGRRAAGARAGRRGLADRRAARRRRRRGAAPARRAPSAAGGADDRLRIRALGPMRLEVGGAVLDGDWLAHRPGQVLKYLVATRGHPVASDELLEAFWPQPERDARRPPTCARPSTRCATGSSRTASARRPRATSPAAAAAATSWPPGAVLVDADAFVAAAEAGLAALRDGDGARAEAALAPRRGALPRGVPGRRAGRRVGGARARPPARAGRPRAARAGRAARARRRAGRGQRAPAAPRRARAARRRRPAADADAAAAPRPPHRGGAPLRGGVPPLPPRVRRGAELRAGRARPPAPPRAPPPGG